MNTNQQSISKLSWCGRALDNCVKATLKQFKETTRRGVGTEIVILLEQSVIMIVKSNTSCKSTGSKIYIQNEISLLILLIS